MKLKKSRIRTQAYLRRMHCRHNIIEDFGEVILTAYDRFLTLEKEMQELIPRAEKNKFAAAKLLAVKRKLTKRELAAGRMLDEFKKTSGCSSVGWIRAKKPNAKWSNPIYALLFPSQKNTPTAGFLF